MKHVKRAAIVGIVLLVIGIISTLLISLTTNRTYYEIISLSKSYQENKVINQTKIDSIDVGFEIGAIHFKKAKNNQISYHYIGSNQIKFRKQVVGNKLIFTSDSQSFTNFSVANAQSSLTIYLPVNHKFDVLAQTSVSAISIKDVSFHDVAIKTDVGSISLNNVKVAGDLNLQSNVGRIKVNDVVEPKNVAINSTVGSINLRNIYSKNVKITSNVGSISYRNKDQTYQVKNLNVYTVLGTKSIRVG